MEESKRFPLIVGLVVVAVAVAYFGLRPSAKPKAEPVEEAVAPPVQAPKATVQEAAPEAPVETPPEQPVARPPEPPKEEPKAVAKEPEKPVEAAPTVVEIDDIVKALEYREDFMPSGYSLMEMPPQVGMTNPGYASAEMLQKASEQLPKELGVQLTLKRMYMAAFKDQANKSAAYAVIEVASADEAVSLQNAMTAKLAQQPQQQGIATFVMRNCMIMVQYSGGDDQVGQTLLAKLKAAVNYKD